MGEDVRITEVEKQICNISEERLNHMIVDQNTIPILSETSSNQSLVETISENMEKRLSKVEVELKFMHDENDRMQLDNQ